VHRRVPRPQAPWRRKVAARLRLNRASPHTPPTDADRTDRGNTTPPRSRDAPFPPGTRSGSLAGQKFVSHIRPSDFRPRQFVNREGRRRPLTFPDPSVTLCSVTRFSGEVHDQTIQEIDESARGHRDERHLGAGRVRLTTCGKPSGGNSRSRIPSVSLDRRNQACLMTNPRGDSARSWEEILS
jgi:hypothetical protein